MQSDVCLYCHNGGLLIRFYLDCYILINHIVDIPDHPAGHPLRLAGHPLLWDCERKGSAMVVIHHYHLWLIFLGLLVVQLNVINKSFIGFPFFALHV